MYKEILEHLIEYLQQKIDSGEHKIFYNDLMHDEKTIDCINAINDTLEENKRLNNIINELEQWLKNCKEMCSNYEFDDSYECNYNFYEQIAIADFIKLFILKKLQELKGDGNNE